MIRTTPASPRSGERERSMPLARARRANPPADLDDVLDEALQTLNREAGSLISSLTGIVPDRSPWGVPQPVGHIRAGTTGSGWFKAPTSLSVHVAGDQQARSDRGQR